VVWIPPNKESHTNVISINNTLSIKRIKEKNEGKYECITKLSTPLVYFNKKRREYISMEVTLFRARRTVSVIGKQT